MTLCHRIVFAEYQALAFTGEGARDHPGRWNHKGFPVIYAAETRALAALEFFIRLTPKSRDEELVIITAEIPERLSTEKLELSSLPPGWDSVPFSGFTRKFGTVWLDENRTAVLFVPSVILPEEHNVLLNPVHPDFKKIRVNVPRTFTYDRRVWK